MWLIHLSLLIYACLILVWSILILVWFLIFNFALVYFNKQLLDEAFVICRIISRAEGEADNSYRDIDNFAYHKNRIQQLFYYTFQVEKTIN